MQIKELLMENEELKERIDGLEKKVQWQRRFINGSKFRLKRVSDERNKFVEKNIELERELAEIKKMGMYEFASKYCTDEQMEKDAKAFARNLGIGG